MKIEDIPESEAAELERRLLPLPHELSIHRKVVISPADVGISAPHAVPGAANRLRDLFMENAGVEADGSGFRIRIEIDRHRSLGALNDVPNREQAYLIEPVGDDELIIAGLEERGVIYGVMTLCQLLEKGFGRGTVTVPLATIVDWPDFEVRGFWGGLPLTFLPQMASLRMNQFECPAWFEAVPDRGLEVRMTGNLEDDPAATEHWSRPFDKARQYAAEVVPGFFHMDFWERRCPGVAAENPQIVGKGESAKGGFFKEKGFRALCASEPRVAELLTEAMMTVASWGVSGVCVWMSEFPGSQCECDRCMEQGQFQAEVRAAVRAWREVREKHPDFTMNVFFGAGGFTPGEKWIPDYPPRAMDEILADLPKEVRMCASMGVRDDVLQAFAGRGGLVNRCFIVSQQPGNYCLGEHVRTRMRQLLAQKARGISQYWSDWGPVADEALDFQLSALAEFSWNAQGRSTRACAESWATRRGAAEPSAYGAWIEIMSRMAAESSSMDEFIRTASWLNELSAVLVGNVPPDAYEGVDVAGVADDRKWQMLEWSKFFDGKRLRLRTEMIVRSAVYGATNSTDQSIANCRAACETAKRLESAEPGAYAELLLRYCELEKAGLELIEDARRPDGIGAFKEAMQRFMSALAAHGDVGEAGVETLERAYRDLLESVDGG
ncbi:MAG: hypothetical protein CMJ18_17565 [Phycisphaeraceae bacterium]|nr:hypothetical protein [Phycisphaeraceae bacterium]